MAYRVSDDAGDDIVQIYAIGVREFGPRLADLYHDGLFDLFDLLAASPGIARERREIDPPVRVHPYGSHIVIYRAEGADILIIRVRHGREDWISDPV